MKNDTVIETRTRPAEVGKLTVYTIAILAVLLIGYILARAMRAYVPTMQVNANRATERSEGLKAVTAAANVELNGAPVYISRPNGIVRLPIERAMELVVQNGKNPAAFRSNLVARADKAATQAPKPPAKPSEFE